MVKYLYAHEPNKKLGSGMENKISGQVKALNNNGVTTKKEGYYKPSKIKRAIPFNTTSIEWDKIDLSNVDGIYTRYLMSDYKFIKFLKRAKEKKIIICIEVPTFPYQKELNWYSLKAIRDKIYKGKLKKYVDRIFYMGGKGNVDNIFGIDCERIHNGIEFENYHIHKTNNTQDIIKLIAVADFQKSHGYERILKGMSEYYKNGGKRKIEFYMVGEGEEKSNYEKITFDLNLDKNVFFLGMLTGEKLDNAYDNANIGVEVFGFYKRGIDTSSSLKSREYLARGIPFICGAKNDSIKADYPYCLFFPNDSSVVDMNKVIDFYDNIYKKNKTAYEISKEIREFGISTVSWEKTMEPVSDFFKKKLKELHKK